MKNELIILRAPSGYGKSTYANKHFVSKGYIQCEADSFFMKDGVYNFDRSKLGAAHMQCQQRTKLHLMLGDNVVVSNTSLTHKEVMDYVRIANDCKVPYRVIRLAKQFTNVHGVPAEVVESMKARLVAFPGEEVLTDY